MDEPETASAASTASEDIPLIQATEDRTEVESTEANLVIRTEWGDVEDLPVQFTNQFIATVGLRSDQGTPDGIYLIFGHVSLPIMLGSPDDIRRQLEARERVTVSAQGRFFLTRDRLDELIKVLSTIRQQHDAMAEKQAGEEQL